MRVFEFEHGSAKGYRWLSPVRVQAQERTEAVERFIAEHPKSRIIAVHELSGIDAVTDSAVNAIRENLQASSIERADLLREMKSGDTGWAAESVAERDGRLLNLAIAGVALALLVCAWLS